MDGELYIGIALAGGLFRKQMSLERPLAFLHRWIVFNTVAAI
jgi:hypothetical protein